MKQYLQLLKDIKEKGTVKPAPWPVKTIEITWMKDEKTGNSLPNVKIEYKHEI